MLSLVGGAINAVFNRGTSVLNHDSRRIATAVNQVEVKQNGIESIDARAAAHARWF